MSHKKLLRSVCRFMVRHSAIVLSAFLLLTLALGWQARKFTIDASAETLLMRNDPDYLRTRLMDRRFSQQEFLLMAHQPRHRPVFSREALAELHIMAEKLRQLERVESVRSILNVPLFSKAEFKQLGQMDPATLTMEHQDYSLDQLQDRRSPIIRL